jgi:hypothetical protein
MEHENGRIETDAAGYPVSRPPEVTPNREGVWVAMYSDRSSFVPFATELDALRFAVGNGMSVVFCHFGTDPVLDD